MNKKLIMIYLRIVCVLILFMYIGILLATHYGQPQFYFPLMIPVVVCASIIVITENSGVK